MTEFPQSETGEPKRLILFGVARLSEMLVKGNVSYVRSYEAYFDSVDVVYLIGRAGRVDLGERTRLLSLGKGQRFFDYILSPWRLYRFARAKPASLYMTADQVFSWWTAILLKFLLRSRIVLVPVSLPEQLYADKGDSISGLPVWLERKMIDLSYRMADVVYTAKAFGAFSVELRRRQGVERKLVVTHSIPEALPSPEFSSALQRMPQHDPLRSEPTVNLVYVGRLHSEKLVGDLIELIARLAKEGPERDFRLRLVGDGPDREHLEASAGRLGVAGRVAFVGAVANGSIPEELSKADIFVSTLTGTSLREAALYGLPIVAYCRDWIVGLLEHERTALLVAPRDLDAMVAAVKALADDPQLRSKLSRNAKQLAASLWTTASVRESLHELTTAIDSR